MKPQTQTLLTKADRALRVAGRLLADGDHDFAVMHAYYVMLYAAEALLAERGVTLREPADVHTALGEYFTTPGRLDAKYLQYLLDASAKRQQGELGLAAPPTREDTRALVARAAEFLAVARTQLQQGT